MQSQRQENRPYTLLPPIPRAFFALACPNKPVDVYQADRQTPYFLRVLRLNLRLWSGFDDMRLKLDSPRSRFARAVHCARVPPSPRPRHLLAGFRYSLLAFVEGHGCLLVDLGGPPRMWLDALRPVRSRVRTFTDSMSVVCCRIAECVKHESSLRPHAPSYLPLICDRVSLAPHTVPTYRRPQLRPAPHCPGLGAAYLGSSCGRRPLRKLAPPPSVAPFYRIHPLEVRTHLNHSTRAFVSQIIRHEFGYAGRIYAVCGAEVAAEGSSHNTQCITVGTARKQT